jgi:hypothetical protein
MASIASRVDGIQTMLTNPQVLYGPAERFPERQRAFLEAKRRIISETAEEIQRPTSAYPSLFHDLLKSLGDKRQKIALEAGSPDVQLFGKLTGDLEDGYLPFTELQGIYQKANEVALKHLKDHMQPMRRTLKEFIDTTKEVRETVHGRSFSTKIEILGAKEMQQFAEDISQEMVTQFGLKLKQERPEITDYQSLEELKKQYPDLYRQMKMHFYANKLITIFPRPTLDFATKMVASGNPANLKSDYVLVTMRTEIAGKMVATNQWFTWLYRNFMRDPIERMVDPDYRPAILVLHEDLFLKRHSLGECARLFEAMVKNRTSSVEELMNQMALFRYIFAQAMPYHRGSAAIAEWFEGAIYQVRGFSCTYRPAYEKESVDLVAIASFKFSDYLQRYRELVQLTAI